MISPQDFWRGAILFIVVVVSLYITSTIIYGSHVARKREKLRLQMEQERKADRAIKERFEQRLKDYHKE